MKFSWVAPAMLAALLGLAGCSGDDGRDGAPGAPGTEGPEGPVGEQGPPGDSVVKLPIESCAVCHSEGSFVDAAAGHEIDREVSYTVVTPPTQEGTNTLVEFEIFVDGEPDLTFTTVQRVVIFQGVAGTYTRYQYDNNDVTRDGLLTVNEQTGVYSFRIPAGWPLGTPVGSVVPQIVGTDARVYFRLQTAAGVEPRRRASISADTADYERLDLVSNESCINCHGNFAGGLASHHYNPFDAGNCIACHSAVNPPEGLGLAYLAHGIHNLDGFTTPEGIYSTTYPTYMTNCSVCHQTEDQLAAANAMPVVAEACFSCHGTTATMFEVTDPPNPLATFHANIVDNCQTCHVVGGVAATLVTVTDAHNELTTERGGIIWNGVDTSVVEGDKIDWQITGVADDGTNLSITWTANYEGVGVNPCNATAGPTAPVFFADGSGNLSILRNYAQGGDYILGTNPNAPGQPGSAVNVTAANTTCAQNVATTVVPVEATDAMYGRVAIQGKPRLPSVANSAALMAVRAFTPTFEWVVGEGGVAPARREVVDSGLCLKCHVGSMYQHGGNRVDNVDMCYLCHNSAANEQFVRVGFGVDASEAYDGRAGQNFGMKEMLHAVHSAGETGAPIVIYRGRGIYAWAGDVSLLSNWPGSGRFPVFGSDDGTGSPVMQNHTFHTPTYPRSLNDCAACHVEGLEILPSALEAMASTVETGDAPFGDQLNDVLEGALASSCMTCHRSDDRAVEAALKAHAYQNGWVPQEFPEGRQTIIEAIK